LTGFSTEKTAVAALTGSTGWRICEVLPQAATKRLMAKIVRARSMKSLLRLRQHGATILPAPRRRVLRWRKASPRLFERRGPVFARGPQSVDVVGPLPGDLQDTLVFVAAIMASASQAEAGKSFIDFLRGAEAAAVIKAKGMEPAIRY
jgi:hypothetical protein